MMLRNLTAAILLGLGSLFSPLLIGQTQAVDAKMQVAAEKVKLRIARFDELTNKAYLHYFTQLPQIEYITIKTGDYQTTNTGLSATTEITVNSNVGDVVIEISNNIVFNDELSAKGIEAHIEGSVVANDSLKALLAVEDDDAVEFAKALEHLTITTDLYQDGKIDQLFEVKPFKQQDEDGNSIEFTGLKLKSQKHGEALIDGVSEVKLNFGQLSITIVDKFEDADYTDSLIFYPFNVDYSQKDGKMSLDVSALKLEASEDNENYFLIAIDGIKGEGSDMHFDDAVHSMLGKQEYVVDNFKVQFDDMLATLIIDSIRIASNLKKDGALYDVKSGITFGVDSESIQKLTRMTELSIEDIDFQFDLDDVSAKLVNLFTHNRVFVIDERDISLYFLFIISDIAENQTGMNVAFTINTDLGDATFIANIKAKKGAVTDLTKWEAAMNAEEPTQAINLLQQSFTFDIKMTLPEDIAAATGIENMITMTTDTIVKDGSNYVMHIKNTDEGIKLNGHLVP